MPRHALGITASPRGFVCGPIAFKVGAGLLVSAVAASPTFDAQRATCDRWDDASGGCAVPHWSVEEDIDLCVLLGSRHTCGDKLTSQAWIVKQQAWGGAICVGGGKRMCVGCLCGCACCWAESNMALDAGIFQRLWYSTALHGAVHHHGHCADNRRMQRGQISRVGTRCCPHRSWVPRLCD